jgi:endoglucanase
MAADYTISPELMNRVDEVASWALDAGLYAVVNLHWDGGWINTWFPKDYDKAIGKYHSVWTQIAQHFKGFSDHLIFESMNEEGSFDGFWSQWDPKTQGNRARAFEMINSINQEFVNVVRSAGGNNSTRFLLINGFDDDINSTCDPLYKMPVDPAKNCILSVHYYSPATFAILDEDAGWGKAASTWGTDAEVAAVKADFAKLKTRYLSQGIPVILGEFGCGYKNKEFPSVVKYLRAVSQTAWELGICPMLWDTPGGRFNREAGTFNPELQAAFHDVSTGPRLY